MTLPEKATITCTGVNSAATVDLSTVSVAVSIGALTTVPNMPARTRATFTNLLTTGRNTGVAAPTITIQGVFEVNGSHGTGAGALIDWEHMLDLLLNSHRTMTLVCDRFKTSANTTGTISVMLQHYSDNYSNSNIVEYTLVFTQVAS